jgi:hypothetical protein
MGLQRAGTPHRMTEHDERTGERDDRATREPAANHPENQPGEHGGDGPGQKPGEAPGPYGNPEVDEEALRKKQEDAAG